MNRLLILGLLALWQPSVSYSAPIDNFAKIAKRLGCPNKPDVNKISLHGHKFNADNDDHRIIVEGPIAKGRFSHYLRFRPDDDVFFTFPVDGSDLSGMKIWTNRGGFGGWVDDLVDGTIGTFFGLIEIQPDATIPPESTEMVDHLRGRSWESQAGAVAAMARWYFMSHRQGNSVCQ